MSDSLSGHLDTACAINRIARGDEEILTASHIATLRLWSEDYATLVSREHFAKYLIALCDSHERLRTEKVLIALTGDGQ